jgi:transmembrane sensor
VTDLGREIESSVRADWGELRAETVWAGVGPRRRRRTVARLSLACATAAVLGGLTLTHHDPSSQPSSPVLQVERSQPPPLEPTSVTPASPPVLHVDRSTHAQLDPAIVAPPDAAPVRVELALGTRRFDVGEERYEIASGLLTIEAQNATFACSRTTRATRVEVFRGTVLVHDGATTRELGAGETVEVRAPSRPPPPRPDPVTELLHTADVMRLAQQPAQAIGPLQRIIDSHGRDPRAPLAAFTLGRILLDDLDRPGEAATSFATAIRLAPEGALVEDALARQVEALARAGNADSAHALAETYVQRFPRGRRLQAVRSAGGLR